MPIPSPKVNRKGNIDEPAIYDQCQTPIEAMDPLWVHLLSRWKLWECACGKQNLSRGMAERGFEVIASDTDPRVNPPIVQNFFHWQPDAWDCIVTNPPFTLKFEWLERCYALGKPFALLLRLEVWGAATAQRLFEKHGVEVILLDKRINFETPGKDGGKTGAWFPVCWYTWGLRIGRQVTYGKVVRRVKNQPALFVM